MTWTYYPASSMTVKDQVRLLIGDTDSTDPLLQDEEINVLISQESGLYRQAAACCRSISSLFGRRVQRQLGDLRLYSQQQYEHYAKLDKTYLLKASRSDVSIYAGGLSISGKQAVEDNDDRVEPAFTRQTGNIPGSEEPSEDITLGPVVSE